MASIWVESDLIQGWIRHHSSNLAFLAHHKSPIGPESGMIRTSICPSDILACWIRAHLDLNWPSFWKRNRNIYKSIPDWTLIQGRSVIFSFFYRHSLANHPRLRSDSGHNQGGFFGSMKKHAGLRSDPAPNGLESIYPHLKSLTFILGCLFSHGTMGYWGI